MKRIFGLVLILCMLTSCLPSLTVAGTACNHEYMEILFEPTCVDEGITVYLCKLCGKNYQDNSVPALGHDLERGYILEGGCRLSYFDMCKRCDFIHDYYMPNHEYEYGACWFCYKEEPNAVYRQIDFPINGEQIVLAYRNYAFNTDFKPLRIQPEDGTVTCPPSQTVWTIHREGTGYILCHRDQALCVEGIQLSLGDRSEACIWTLIPDKEQGCYRFYCEAEGVYLTESSQGWVVSDTFSRPLTMYAYCDHVFLEPAVAEAATCRQEGILQRKCVLCEGYYEEPIPVEPHSYKDGACVWCGITASEEHIWSEPTMVAEATCTQGAKEYRTCTLCGEITVTISSERKSHDRKVLYVGEPSCKNGKIEYTGCACGAYITENYLESKNHDYTPWVVTENKHVSYLTQESICLDCGAKRAESQFGLPHDFGDWTAETLPTCTKSGTFYRQCATCHDTEKRSIEPFGHDIGQWQTVKEPTCTENGQQCRKCKYCSEAEYVSIPATKHTWSQPFVSLEPTCTEEGQQCRKCLNCSAEEGTPLPMVDHTWDQGVIKVEPTWTKEGQLVYTCLQCGKEESETIDAIGKEACTGGETCWSYSFTDVPDVEHWAHEGIDFAIQSGLFNGMNETTFAPDLPMTRAMLVTVLWRYAGSPMEGENIFTDVEPEMWYTDAVAWAAEEQIINGVGHQRFDPMGKITREQLATILYRYTQSMGAELPREGELADFPDCASVHTWAEEALAWAVGEKLIMGVQQGTEVYLAPQGTATRAQVATILLRYCESIATG